MPDVAVGDYVEAAIWDSLETLRYRGHLDPTHTQYMTGQVERIFVHPYTYEFSIRDRYGNSFQVSYWRVSDKHWPRRLSPAEIIVHLNPAEEA